MYNSSLKQKHKQNQKSQQLKDLLKRKKRKKKEQTQQELLDQACKNQIYSFKGQNYKLFQKIKGIGKLPHLIL